MITVYNLSTDEQIYFHDGMIGDNEYEKLAMAVCYCDAKKNNRMSEYLSLTHSGDYKRLFATFTVYIGRLSVGCGDFVAKLSEG